jgi:hypothetical protein
MVIQNLQFASVMSDFVPIGDIAQFVRNWMLVCQKSNGSMTNFHFATTI